MKPGQRARLGGKLSFKDMTTRKHYPGTHRLEVVVNGVNYPLGEFRLEARQEGVAG